MKPKGSLSKKHIEKIKLYLKSIGKDVDIKPNRKAVK